MFDIYIRIPNLRAFSKVAMVPLAHVLHTGTAKAKEGALGSLDIISQTPRGCNAILAAGAMEHLLFCLASSVEQKILASEVTPNSKCLIRTELNDPDLGGDSQGSHVRKPRL